MSPFARHDGRCEPHSTAIAQRLETPQTTQADQSADKGSTTRTRGDGQGGRGGSRAGAFPRRGTAGRRAASGQSVSQPRALLARLQRAGAAPRRGPGHAAAGAGEVPRDLRQQPRRVLHGAGGRAEAAAANRPADAHVRRAQPARTARRDHRARRRTDRPARALLRRRGRTAARRRGHRDRAMGRPRRRRARAHARLLPRAGLPGAHPARGRPGAPVPVHLRPGSEPGRARARPDGTAGELFARVKVPNNVPRLVSVGRDASVVAGASIPGTRYARSCRWKT